MRKYLNKFLLYYFKKFDPTFLRSFHPYYNDVHRSKGFDDLYNRVLKSTQTKASLWRRDRFYNLYSAVELVKNLQGNVIELGCYRGLSSYLICTRLKELNQNFSGEGYLICDSFKGLSSPTTQDQLPENFSGMFATESGIVKKNLSDFPLIQYFDGWIPEVFLNLPEAKYRFVHIDVDLVEPTVASFEYFYPRMVNGGIIVCDDYGGKIWKGTKVAVDDFCDKYKIQTLRLSTGQIFILKS